MKYFKLLLTQLFILAIIGCISTNNQNNQKIFKFNMSGGLTSLDPAFSKDQNTMWVARQLFDGLVQVNNRLEIIPSIAKSWKVSEDGKTYTFILRDDVYFNDNELIKEENKKVKAQDFVYSLGRLIDDEIASPGGWLFRDKVVDIAPFKAINDTLFQINLKIPFRPLLGMLALPYCSVVPKDVADHYGKDFRAHPIGTGPFKLKLWKDSDILFLEKNENYFEKDKLGNSLPYIDGIRISFLIDRQIELDKFIAGELDFISGIVPETKDRLLTSDGQLKENLKNQFKLEKHPYMNTEYLGFSMKNQSVEALKNKKVRQAINYGFDRKKMIQYLQNNIGIPANAGMIPPAMASFNDTEVKGYKYDIEKAKQLLIEAGYPNGKGIDEIKLHTSQNYLQLTTYISKALEEIGLKISLENVPAAFQREQMRNNQLDFFRASWIGDYPDGENYLALFYGGHGAPPNYTFFKNDRYDELYKKAIVEDDPEEYIKLYHEMENIVLDEAPVVPLFYDEVVRFINKRVTGLQNNGMNMLILKEVQLN